ncbi:MAG: hypothetical protein D4Q77_01070 [Methanothrix sp.]|nr:MAG: hypothetical protein D4Q77_01070 [Methanothrix sp.]
MGLFQPPNQPDLDPLQEQVLKRFIDRGLCNIGIDPLIVCIIRLIGAPSERMFLLQLQRLSAHARCACTAFRLRDIKKQKEA